jgi:protein TonB
MPDEAVRSGSTIPEPAILELVDPKYPTGAVKAHMQGAVILDLLIDPEGGVQDVTVLRGAPLGLTEAAVEAAWRWRFARSTVDGKQVSVRTVQTIRFILE